MYHEHGETCSDCKIAMATTFYGIGQRCSVCAAHFLRRLQAEREEAWIRERAAYQAHLDSDHEDGEACPECCPHDDVDSSEGYTCLSCGSDQTENVLSAAYDRAKDLRKYG